MPPARFRGSQRCVRQLEKPGGDPHHVRPEIDCLTFPGQPAQMRDEETALSDAAPQTPIVIYTSAMCPYCVSAKNFLKSKGLSWSEIRIDTDPAERERMLARTRRTSVPQIFVGDVHVGGFDDMMALHRAGKFEPLLNGEGA
jgi:glutaredoxin 3